MKTSKNILHPYIERALTDPSVKGNFNRFKNNPDKLTFFVELIRSRNINNTDTYGDVLELVRDASLYTVNIKTNQIKESINFFKHKPDHRDMKRQSYGVYTPPRIKD